MRGPLLNLPAVARAIGFALVAIAIVAATLHFREAPSGTQDRRAAPDAAPYPLSDELRRCRVIATEAKDDAGCEAAWAESRRRFFTYQPAPCAATPPAASAKSSDW
jgi:conjugative transfer region protein TrbK